MRSCYLEIQVNEPSERVLVHGLNASQVRDTEKQDGRVGRYRLVTITSLVNFLLCCRGDFLQTNKQIIVFEILLTYPLTD